MGPLSDAISALVRETRELAHSSPLHAQKKSSEHSEMAAAHSPGKEVLE